VHQVVVRLARGDDPEPGVAFALHTVDVVDARVLERQLAAHSHERALELERRRRQQAAVGHVLVAEVRQDRGDAAGRHLGGADRVGHAGDDLEAGPQAGGSRAGVGVQPELDHLAGVAGIEDRHPEAGEQRLRRAWDRGGLAARVVAHDGERAAGARDAHEVAVAQGIGRAVEPGGLAVPHAEHAVVARARQVLRELAAPGRSGAELLVQPRHVADEVLLEQLAVALELAVEPAQRRALVAGDQGAGQQPAAEVGTVMVDHEPDQRLDAGDQDAPVLEQVLVVEANLAPFPAAVPVGSAVAAVPTARRSRPPPHHRARLPRHW
jgi:hypothetical protein